MSQTFFSKQDAYEKNNRLTQLGTSKGAVTLWVKGSQKDKTNVNVLKFDKDRSVLVLESKEDLFPTNSEVLCTFEIRGMIFFSQVTFLKSVGDFSVLHFKGDLFKTEKRSSYRLLTYPLYDVWVEFDLGEAYEGGNVVDMKLKTSQTKLFQNFLKIVEGDQAGEANKLKIRVQDISATGMSIHIGELESKYFIKDSIFKNVVIAFPDERIEIPEVKVVYVVSYISNDKNLKKFKIGIHFPNLSPRIDDLLSKKINKLLREIDANKDFETFIK